MSAAPTLATMKAEAAMATKRMIRGSRTKSRMALPPIPQSEVAAIIWSQ